MSIADPWPLTDRERQVLAGLAAGALPEVVAVEMSVSLQTLRNHLETVTEKVQGRIAPQGD